MMRPLLRAPWLVVPFVAGVLLAGCGDEDTEVSVTVIASPANLSISGVGSSRLQVVVLQGDSVAPLGTPVTVSCLNPETGDPAGVLEGGIEPDRNAARIVTDSVGSAQVSLTCGPGDSEGFVLRCQASALGASGLSPVITCAP